MKSLTLHFFNADKSKRKYNIECWFFVLLCFLSSSVFGQSTSLYIESIWVLTRIINLLFIIYGAYLLLNKRKADNLSVGFSIVIGIYWVIDFICSFHSTIFSLIPIVILIYYSLEDKKTKYLTYILFEKGLLIISAVGIVTYVCYVFNIISPFSISSFYEEGALSVYANYYISILYVNPSSFLCRLCGIFNEPGMMGTMCALTVICERLCIKKIDVLIIFVAGVLSFSLAFWMLILIYMAINSIVNKNYKQLIVLITIVASYGTIVQLETHNENVNRLISRITIEDRKLEGDNRINDSLNKLWEETQKNTETLLFGIGRDVVGIVSSSYLVFLVKYGVVGTLVILIPFIILVLKMCKGNRDALIVGLCFIASIYQRPQIFTLCYMIILLGGIQYNLLHDKSDKRVKSLLL